MPKIKIPQSRLLADREAIAQVSRRRFLGYAGAATGLMAVASSCKKEDMQSSSTTLEGVDLGSGDPGILNYAYALEQLEAAFYIKVIESQFSGITSNETSLLTDIRDHEIAHREFFKNALKEAAIIDLEVDFSSIDFGSRDSVLSTAKAFEDLGVSAYNGAGRLIVTPAYLVLAGKIVSVEARHAALIRELIAAGTFADETAVDMVTGLDGAKKPADVLAIAQKYIKTTINASNLPTY
ncbi:MAG TPA: ferritin-like domain-containing protein [Flavitalea sp.]|nr:ferritin-like domain-containing protein [Flavitalea sp.]